MFERISHLAEQALRDEPPSQEDALWILSRLKRQKKYYASKGQYENPEERNQVLQLFDSAISEVLRINSN